MGSLTSGQFVDAPDIDPITFDTGDVCWSARRTKTGWLKCDGSAVSRTTYATLFAAIVPSLGTFTVTVASPGVFTLTAHGFVIGDRVYLTTTGALPTGLSANTIYYVVSTPTSDTFTLSATEGGSAINTSGTQSGTHTLHYCPHGLGDGSTTFNLPDAPGRSLVASAGASGHADVRAQGQNDGNALASRRYKHKHTVVQPSIAITDPGHSHTYSEHVSGTGLGLVNSNGQPTPTATSTSTTGITASASGGTVGPQTGAEPTDGAAALVLNLFIKT